MTSRRPGPVLFPALGAVVFACVALTLEYWPSSNAVKWVELETALLRAEEAGGRIYVDIYADWCIPCRRMEREVFQDDSVRSVFGPSLIPVRVDLESELGERIKREYSINGIPTSLILNKQGQEAKRRVGMMSPKQFLAWLKDPVQSVFASWQPFVFARLTAQEGGKPLLVLAIKDKSNLELLEKAFAKPSTQEFVSETFIPALLVESVGGDKAFLDEFGGKVIPEQTLGALLVFENGLREIARIPVTTKMLWSDSDIMQTLLPYTESSRQRSPAARR